MRCWGDSSYGGGAARAALRAAGYTQTIKPLPLHSAVPGGFTIHDFRIDRQAATLTCPAGRTVPITSSGQASFARHCQRCRWPHYPPAPPRGRAAHRPPSRGDPRLPAKLPAWRPMVERSLAWLVADGCRRVPYRGIDRNDLWWSVRVAAVNLRRLLALSLARQDQTWVLA